MMERSTVRTGRRCGEVPWEHSEPGVPAALRASLVAQDDAFKRAMRAAQRRRTECITVGVAPARPLDVLPAHFPREAPMSLCGSMAAMCADE